MFAIETYYGCNTARLNSIMVEADKSEAFVHGDDKSGLFALQKLLDLFSFIIAVMLV